MPIPELAWVITATKAYSDTLTELRYPVTKVSGVVTTDTAHVSVVACQDVGQRTSVFRDISLMGYTHGTASNEKWATPLFLNISGDVFKGRLGLSWISTECGMILKFRFPKTKLIIWIRIWRLPWKSQPESLKKPQPTNQTQKNPLQRYSQVGCVSKFKKCNGSQGKSQYLQ